MVIKLVIVDDEKMIRQGLASTISWEAYNIAVVGVAKDGQQALEICREEKPHFVLTDIRMPKMNGIELLQVLKEEMPYVKVVILSGYDEFSYAQQAIQYGALDYLVKPIDIQELEKIIMKVKSTLEQELFGDLTFMKQYQELEHLMEPYFNGISAGVTAEASAIFAEIAAHIDGMNITLENLKKIIVHMTTCLEKSLKLKGYFLEDAQIRIYHNMHEDMIRLNAKKDILQWGYRFTEELCEWIQSQKESGGSSRILIKKATDYMESHYQEELIVEHVAAVVSLSPNYFSHIFKKVRGECFTDYLNKLRIEAAKQYLMENEYKIYEVAYKVGYKDYKYFSYVFKRYVGVSPTRYCELSK